MCIISIIKVAIITWYVLASCVVEKKSFSPQYWIDTILELCNYGVTHYFKEVFLLLVINYNFLLF